MPPNPECSSARQKYRPHWAAANEGEERAYHLLVALGALLFAVVGRAVLDPDTRNTDYPDRDDRAAAFCGRASE